MRRLIGLVVVTTFASALASVSAQDGTGSGTSETRRPPSLTRDQLNEVENVLARESNYITGLSYRGVCERSGASASFVMDLHRTGRTVSGSIQWTLPNGAAVERVVGMFDSGTDLQLVGLEVDKPGAISPASYRLQLFPDGNTLRACAEAHDGGGALALRAEPTATVGNRSQESPVEWGYVVAIVLVLGAMAYRVRSGMVSSKR